ncbi:MAG TPA: tetratricopeptide repeat protein [Burkholderiales bacterium]|nr:tetratricopeptide repeat protein [Burkholderiales bacterium]
MRLPPALAAFFVLIAGLHAGSGSAQWNEDVLQRVFEAAMEQLAAGNAAQAERILTELNKRVPSARVKLELARALYAQGKFEEARALFREVSSQTDTPWRVRDNIERFVAVIEERTGYLRWGATVVSDTNPKSVPAQKEFAIGDLSVTPTEAPEKRTGVRYSIQGWKPLSASTGAYGAAAYADFPRGDMDRLTVDGGLVTRLDESGRLRAKAGLEAGSFAGELLYAYPHLGLDTVLHEDALHRVAAEGRVGAVHFPDFRYLDATNVTAAVSVSRAVSRHASASLRAALEHSEAAERPYSYGGLDVDAGFSVLLPDSAFVLTASTSLGSRDYAEADPLFGAVRKDRKARAEIRIGNKNWRWRDKTISLLASLEKNDSSIGFYSYRKTSVSLLVE